MKKWEKLSPFTVENSSQFTVEQFVKILLTNRGLKTKKDIAAFLDPQLADVTIDTVDIDKKQLKKAVKRIEESIQKKERVIIFGDYDVDGICGTAILWETLFVFNPNAMPYIPHRIDEGYGLSINSIDHVLKQYPDSKLIITVDNGIVAGKAVAYANKKKIDVIITDHHVVADKLPNALAIVHTTKLCGTGVAWLLSQEIKQRCHPGEATISIGSQKDSIASLQNDIDKEEHLELVALATIADLVPLLGANRTLTKKGLEVLAKTKRVGLLELFKEAVLNPAEITSYHVGHSIAPRLNAMGRLEYAMESLRLLCTNNVVRAQNLALTLGTTNRDRQQLTVESVAHAKTVVEAGNLQSGKLLFIAHERYQQGVIGLVAGRLVEQYYRPSIVLSIGETYAKASARSIAGFNIIEFIRTASEHLVDAGGHPMAAGFTVEVAKLTLLREALTQKAEELLTEDMFMRTIKIDCELPFLAITNDLFAALQQFAPFGMGNPEPVFMSKEVKIVDKRLIGKDQTHVKFKFSQENKIFDAIAFGMAESTAEMNVGDSVDIAYTIDENVWNGNRSLQLKVKDIVI